MRIRAGGVRVLAVLAVGLVASVLLVGCGAPDMGSREEAAAPAGGGGPADDAGAEGGAGDSGGGAGDPGGTGSTQLDPGGAGGALVDGRDIIYTGEITVRVERVEPAAREVAALARRHGGFVAGDRRTAGDGARATLVLRIPSENVTAAVDGIAGVGTETSRALDTEDVTEELVDLDTRIATVRASVDRTRELLERAESISDIVEVEAELAEREATLASLQARQRELADRTSLSTITASLLGPDEQADEVEATDLGFRSGLVAGWRAFAATMTVLVTVLGALLPWLVAAAVPATAAVWWLRRRRATPPPA